MLTPHTRHRLLTFTPGTTPEEARDKAGELVAADIQGLQLVLALPSTCSPSDLEAAASRLATTIEERDLWEIRTTHARIQAAEQPDETEAGDAEGTLEWDPEITPTPAAPDPAMSPTAIRPPPGPDCPWELEEREREFEAARAAEIDLAAAERDMRNELAW